MVTLLQLCGGPFWRTLYLSLTLTPFPPNFKEKEKEQLIIELGKIEMVFIAAEILCRRK